MIGTLIYKKCTTEEASSSKKYIYSVINSVNKVIYNISNIKDIYSMEVGQILEFDIIDKQAVIRLTQEGQVRVIDWESELLKCKNSPYYFAITYLKIDGKSFTTHLSEQEYNQQFKKFCLT